MNTNTPETEAFAQSGKAHYMALDFARKLERERDEARKLLRDANRGAERNAHISQSLASQLVEARRELDEARSQLYRICKEGFGNDDTIGLEPADDYVLRKLAEVKAERDLARERGQDMVDVLSIAEDERYHYRCENAEMREAIKDAHSALGRCLKYILRLPLSGSDAECETMDDAHHALRKLQPFLK